MIITDTNMQVNTNGTTIMNVLFTRQLYKDVCGDKEVWGLQEPYPYSFLSLHIITPLVISHHDVKANK